MNCVKRIITFLCVLSIVFSFSLTVGASKASYDDVPEKYIFSTTSKADKTDLFENFKNAMPGDTLTQEIVIENKNTNRMAVKFFLRSLGADGDSAEFLSQLKLTVKEKDKSPFFEAPADQKAGLQDYLELGTVAPGGKVTLLVSLSIPIELGNEYQDAVGKIRWQLKSEEQPIETKVKYCPKCGSEMIIKTVVVDGHTHCVYYCPHCGYQEDMHCDICGSNMKKVLVQGEDGKFYYYYECLSPEKHHTSPVTADNSNVTVLSSALCVAFVGLTLSVFALRRDRKKEEEAEV